MDNYKYIVYNTFLPILKSVSAAIIREFDEYLYFRYPFWLFERFAGLLNHTAPSYPPRLNLSSG